MMQVIRLEDIASRTHNKQNTENSSGGALIRNISFSSSDTRSSMDASDSDHQRRRSGT